jgi:hypothetical protein
MTIDPTKDGKGESALADSDLVALLADMLRRCCRIEERVESLLDSSIDKEMNRKIGDNHGETTESDQHSHTNPSSR